MWDFIQGLIAFILIAIFIIAMIALIIAFPLPMIGIMIFFGAFR